MSASDPTSAIYVTDTPKQIKDKVNKYAFSGGRLTVEEHREKGGDLEVDISWKWLNFFMDDDDKLRTIGEAYGSGAMLSGEIKKELVECLTPMIVAHQEARAKVSDAVVDQFFSTAPAILTRCSASSSETPRLPRRARCRSRAARTSWRVTRRFPRSPAAREIMGKTPARRRGGRPAAVEKRAQAHRQGEADRGEEGGEGGGEGRQGCRGGAVIASAALGLRPLLLIQHRPIMTRRSVVGSQSHRRPQPRGPLLFPSLLGVPRPRQRASGGHERGAQSQAHVPRERPKPQRAEPPQTNRILVSAPSAFSPSVELFARVRVAHGRVPVRRRRVPTSPAARSE